MTGGVTEGDPLAPAAVRAEVVALLRQAVAEGAALGWVDPPPADEVEQLLADVRAGLTSGAAGVAVEVVEGQVVGFGYWRRYARPTHAPQADLERVVVSAAHRGQGLGRRLVTALVAQAAAAGVETLTLDVRGDNHGAITLYEQLGFRRYGHLPDFVAVGDARHDKVFMALRPGAPPPPPQRTDHLVGWAVVRREDGRVLLARRDGVSYGSGLWGLPGGHVDDDESLASGTARELHEEVGLRAEATDLEPVGVTRYVDGPVRGTDFFFVVRRWEGEPQPTSECSEVGWFDPEHLPDDALPWLAGTLREHLLDGRWLADHPQA
ncbi:hypothetical protein GCM10027446_07450 [Angustibacter peucedani]